MDAKVQRRVQRYGWDLAARDYEPAWAAQLAPAHAGMRELARLAPGERVLDVASGTGLIAFDAAWEVGAEGAVLGVDISGEMVEAAGRRAAACGLANVRFARMDAEALDLPDASFDVALCGLGLMYAPDPVKALDEMRRVLRRGGRAVVGVWGERARCGWAAVFPIVDAEVKSDVCPMFFQLGERANLADACVAAGFRRVELRRIRTVLSYPDAQAACDAAFVGGPVALAWSRFDPATRARARAAYVEAIAPWRMGDGYELPGEFVMALATAEG
jgi:SAM-dependent methyltransferase